MKKTLSLLLSLCMLFTLTLSACSAAETPKEKTDTVSEETISEGSEKLSESEPENIVIKLTVGKETLSVNGTEKPIDEQGTAPVILQNRTFLPVRAVVEEMGGTVDWNDETETVTLKCAADTVSLTIDSTTAYYNGEETSLDVAPTVRNNRTFLPIRFIAESFHFDVAYDETTRTVTLSKQKTEEPTEGGKSLVVYFSATGNTKALAEKIAETSGSELWEIVPEQPYTDEDLNYGNKDCRADLEQHDPDVRPKIAGTIEKVQQYDTIFLGYPIWWGTMPKIILTFLESYDLSGKTILPFCTSGGSGIATSVAEITKACPDSSVKEGLRGSASSGDETIQKWLDTVGFSVKDGEDEA